MAGSSIYLGFNAGGFFAGTTGIATVVLVAVLIAVVTMLAGPAGSASA